MSDIMNAILGIVPTYHPRYIPNQRGFVFTAVLNDKSEVRCQVDKEVNLHYVVNYETRERVAFGTIVSWKY